MIYEKLYNPIILKNKKGTAKKLKESNVRRRNLANGKRIKLNPNELSIIANTLDITEKELMLAAFDYNREITACKSIKYLRKKYAVKIIFLAKYLGETKETVYFLEQGQLKVPDEVIEKYSQLFDVAPSNIKNNKIPAVNTKKKNQLKMITNRKNN